MKTLGDSEVEKRTVEQIYKCRVCEQLINVTEECDPIDLMNLSWKLLPCRCQIDEKKLKKYVVADLQKINVVQ